MTTFVAKLLICSMLLCSVGFQFAAAEDSKFGITLQIDSDELLMNDKKMKVEKPYLDNGSTLVPLRVITSGFGAKLNWNDKSRTIEITYGVHVIVLKIDSIEATVDGAKSEMPAAPKLINGTTMVPLRFISETFGAKVTFDPDTQQISIKGNLISDASTGDSTNLDTDAGKAYIGDSYNLWTMKYPTELIKSSQTFKDNVLVFQDAKDQYQLMIGVHELDGTLSNDALLKRLTDMVKKGTILEKSFVTTAKYPYARIVTKGSESTYLEYRAIQSNGKYYYMVLMLTEINYKNDEKRRYYTELLNSFAPEYDKARNDIKDVSTVKAGMREYTDANSGVTIKVPVAWNKSEGKESLAFYGDDDKEGAVSIRVTSAAPGDTLDQWVTRQETHIKDMLLPEYLESAPIKDVKISGIPAKQLKIRAHWGNISEKKTEYSFYLFVGKYKYEVRVKFHNAQDDEYIVNKIIESIKIKTDNVKLGLIQDDRDFGAQNQVSTIRNKKYNIQADIPDSWSEITENKSDSTVIKYDFVGGTLGLYAYDDISLDQASRYFDNLEKKKAGEVTDLKYTDQGSNTTMLGVTAKRFIYEGTDKGVPFVKTTYLFEKGGTVFSMEIFNFKANRTQYSLKEQAAVLNSFKFN